MPVFLLHLKPTLVMFKYKSLLLLLLFDLATFAQSASSKLKMNRELMAGEWMVDERVDFFSFKNDTSGVWSSIGIASKTPLFVIRVIDDHSFIIPVTEQGKRTDPIEIRSIDQKKMVLYYLQSKERLVFKKVANSD